MDRLKHMWNDMTLYLHLDSLSTWMILIIMYKTPVEKLIHGIQGEKYILA